jgi:hypothetical protein
VSDLFDTTERRRRRAAEELAGSSDTSIRLDDLERTTNEHTKQLVSHGLFYKIITGALTLMLSGAGGTALYFYSRAEDLAEVRGAERVRLDRNERDIAEVRALVNGLLPFLRNLPAFGPAHGDDR